MLFFHHFFLLCHVFFSLLLIILYFYLFDQVIRAEFISPKLPYLGAILVLTHMDVVFPIVSLSVFFLYFLSFFLSQQHSCSFFLFYVFTEQAIRMIIAYDLSLLSLSDIFCVSFVMEIFCVKTHVTLSSIFGYNMYMNFAFTDAKK
jgi:hypothetical protein